jgi:S-adenosylmethionine hydrolase
MMTKNIALLTDFGNDSHYVGVMKGVISGISPESKVIDLCHNIEPQNIKQAAFILKESVDHFPDGTVFCCVVDPGVGSDRKPLVIETEKHTFITPDNGLITPCLHKYDFIKITDPNRKYFLEDISNTFHGRDVFAPLAAHIANGKKIDGNYIDINDIIMLPDLKVNLDKDMIMGEMIYADRFGNIITSIDKKAIINLVNNMDIYNYRIEVIINDRKIQGISKAYTDVGIDDFLAYIGSTGYLEIGIRNGNALSVLCNVDSIIVKKQQQ